MKKLFQYVFLSSSLWQRRAFLSTLPPLTKDRYNIQRGSFKTLTDKDVQFFEKILGKNRTLTDSSDVAAYNVDWMNTVRGYSQCVLKPKTTEEVSSILKYCSANHLAVCPQGGNTGLVGGSVPVFDEVILSMNLMNNVISMDEISGVLICQAGCILENLESYVQEHGFVMPLDLGAKGSCQIGGNVSTNAGGLRLIRYGSLHGSVLGLEAVLANGDILDCLSGLKKDNTGYHLKHLFIGSEGTLGIVTKVAIHCPPLSSSNSVAFLGLDSFEKVLATFRESRKQLSEILSSCEMMDQDSLNAVQDNLNLHTPIGEFPFYMLIETSGSNSKHDEEKLSHFVEVAMEKGLVSDGTLATEPSRIQKIFEVRTRILEALSLEGELFMYDVSTLLKDFYLPVLALKNHLKNYPDVLRVNGYGHLGMISTLWQSRERITEALTKEGYVFKYDVSVPHTNFYLIVSTLRERLASNDLVIRTCGYGHVGDGNLHLNIVAKQFTPELLSVIEPYVFEWVSKHGGSVSAEHGIGFKKTKFIHYSKSPSSLHLMRKLKTVMDPKGILNPYKVLPLDK